MQPTVHHRTPSQYSAGGLPDAVVQSPVIAKQYGIGTYTPTPPLATMTPAPRNESSGFFPVAGSTLAPRYTKSRPPPSSVVHKWVYFIVSLITLITTVVICITPVYTIDLPDDKGEVVETPWKHKECINVIDSEGKQSPECDSRSLPDDAVSTCADVRSRQRAIQAMTVLAIMFAVVAVVVSVLERFLGMLALKYDSLILLVAFVPVFLFNFFSWAVMAGTFHANSCDGNNMKEDYYRMSASFALSLCLWLLHIMFLIFFAFIANREGEL